MIYATNNAAKQWIFEQLAKQAESSAMRVLDLACGDGHLWMLFTKKYPQVKIVGADTDREAIERGRKLFQGNASIDLRVHDAQRRVEAGAYDDCVAFSAMEHVVDRPAFLRTVWSALRSGGMAYLNYDDGHFRSHSIRERLMVPISQLLAKFGYEAPYMKRVDDALLQQQAEACGFQFVNLRKQNMFPLKGFMKKSSEDAETAWYAFEDQMNALFDAKRLHRIMASSILVLKKP